MISMLYRRTTSPGGAAHLVTKVLNYGLEKCIVFVVDDGDFLLTKYHAAIDGLNNHQLRSKMKRVQGLRLRNQFVITLILAFILSACRATSESRITKVGIHVTPDDGYAYCEFTADGWAEGGHESGGPEPFVHVNQEKLTREKINEIWAAAGAIDIQAYPLETSARRECEGCVDLFIHYLDGKVMHLSWPFGEQHPDRKVQDLEELLYEYNVGGW